MAHKPTNVVRLVLKGVDELRKAFNAIPRYLRAGALKKAVNKAGRIMVPPLRRATPKSKKGSKSPKATPSGTLRKSTGIVIRKYKGGAMQSAYVGHRWPKGAAAHLNEAGTKVRQTKRGQNRGRMTAKPFFGPVYAAHKSQVESVLETEIKKGMHDAVNKAAAKALKKAAAKDR